MISVSKTSLTIIFILSSFTHSFAQDISDSLILQKLNDKEIRELIGNGVMISPRNLRDTGIVILRNEKFLKNDTYTAIGDWATISGRYTISDSRICIKNTPKFDQCRHFYKDKTGHFYLSYNGGDYIIEVIIRNN